MIKSPRLDITQLVEAGVTPHYAHENKSYLTSLFHLLYHPNPSLTHVSLRSTS